MSMSDFTKYGLTPCDEKPSGEQIKQVKGMGFLRDTRQNDTFNARVITGNGRITAKEMHKIAEAAERYGDGYVAMTTRQTIEVGAIPYRNIPAFLDFLGEAGLEVGGTGPRVRPIVSCKGTTCVFGLIDTYAISRKIHERFYRGFHSVTLPHKFKIAVGGCPNSCVKPDLNDLGIIGAVPVSVDPSLCRHCATCAAAKACPMQAVTNEKGLAEITPAACNSCARCVKACPFGAIRRGEPGYRIVIGGRWGKRRAVAEPLPFLIRDEETLYALIEAIICLFRDAGIAGERFADTVRRLGFDAVVAHLREQIPSLV